MLTDEYRHRILRLLETNPHASQRRIAGGLGVGLGRANYYLKVLIQRGLVKTKDFRNSANRRAYLYRLTAKGLEAKARVTARFLRAKMREYESLREELEQLQREATAARLREGEPLTAVPHLDSRTCLPPRITGPETNLYR